MSNGGPVTGVKSIRLEHFKGFHGSHSIDVDADIVLIAGPNGYGKSSLLEALALVLTGWNAQDADPAQYLISRKPGKHQPENRDAEPSEPERSCRLTAEVRQDDRKEGTIVWSLQLADDWTPGDDVPKPRHVELPESRLKEKGEDTRDLESRLCAFFQDRLERLFDETASGTLLRDVLEPRAGWVNRTLAAAENAADRLQRAVEAHRKWNGLSADEIHRSLDLSVATFVPLYRELLKGVEGEGWPPKAPPRFGSDESWSQFATDVLLVQSGRRLHLSDAALPRLFVVALTGPDGEMARQIAQARTRASGQSSKTDRQRLVDLEQRLSELRVEQTLIEKRFPTLEQDLECFTAADPQLPDALSIFKALAENAQSWAGGRNRDGLDQRFSEVLTQLAAVVPEASAKCAESLETWLEPRRQAAGRLEVLGAERTRVEREIKRLQSAARVTDLQRIAGELRTVLDILSRNWIDERERLDFERREAQRDEAATLIEDARKTLSWLDAKLEDLTKPSHTLMHRLAGVATWVMRRFSTVPGLLPLHLVHLDRGYRILTADGRELVQLSTGQRAQAGIAMLVAQNREVSDLLSHHILLLDDVSTSYDLSNLTREALLWRQLTYGSTGRFRRQIFISSHHEDLTNHLLDLLVPPQGKRLRLVRFTGWFPDTGPAFDVFEAEPTSSARADSPALRWLVREIEEEQQLWTVIDEEESCRSD